MPHGCKFNNLWLVDPEFKDWIKENEKDSTAADCMLCKTTFSLKTMGRTALTSHTKSQKHLNRLTSCPSVRSTGKKAGMIFYFDSPMAASTSQSTASTSCSKSTANESPDSISTEPNNSDVSDISKVPSFSRSTQTDKWKPPNQIAQCFNITY